MKNILAVDDDKSILETIDILLSDEGYNVFSAESAEVAIDFVESEKIDLIISDISLPEMDGLEFCKIIRENPSYKKIPFIFLSANNDVDEIILGLSAGASEYITKPFNNDILLEKIKQLIKQTEKTNGEPLELFGILGKSAGQKDLPNLLDLCEKNVITGVVNISSKGRCGRLYYQDGELVKIELGNLDMESAMNEMLQWDSGSYIIELHDQLPSYQPVETAVHIEDKPSHKQVVQEQKVDNVSRPSRSSPEAKAQDKVIPTQTQEKISDVKVPKDKTKPQETPGANSRVDVAGKALYVQTSVKHYQCGIESVAFEKGITLSITEVVYPENSSNEEINRILHNTHQNKVAEVKFLFSIQEKIPPDKDPSLHNRMGLLFYHKGYYEQAILEFKRAIDLEPDNIFVYHNLARAYTDKGRYTEAINIYKDALKRNASSAYLYYVYYGLASAYLKSGSYTNSLSAVDKAISLNPQYGDAYLLRGILTLEILIAMGQQVSVSDKHNILKNLETAIRFNPTYNNEEYKKGLSFLEKNEFKQALESFKKACILTEKLAREDIACELYLRMKYNIKELNIKEVDSYIKEFQNAIENGLYYPDLYNAQGIACLLQCINFFNYAVDRFNKALTISSATQVGNPAYERAKKNLSLTQYENKGLAILLKTLTME